DTPNARIVPAGGLSTICLDAPRDLGVDGLNNDREVRDNCFWTVPQRFTDWEAFETFPNLPPNLLIYDIELPNEPIIVEDCDVNPDWLDDYTVVLGDTLSYIAPRYNLTAEELGFGNCLADYDLIIPNQILR
ncbi:MAG TPA: LysM domain-containing protein, partial [Aggregatilineales bacterium]|nr:LysM domain-containing protein [Aggregatilineales bacterium]